MHAGGIYCQGGSGHTEIGLQPGNASVSPFPYLIVIWFVLGAEFLTQVDPDHFFGFGSRRWDGFQLRAKFRVLRMKGLISSCRTKA